MISTAVSQPRHSRTPSQQLLLSPPTPVTPHPLETSPSSSPTPSPSPSFSTFADQQADARNSAEPLLATSRASDIRRESFTSDGRQPVSTLRTAKWERDWLGLALVALAGAVLTAWIVVAAVMAAKKVFRPLDWLGGGIVTLSSYNVVITASGTAVSIAVGTAISFGVRAILRRRMISKNGVSLDSYAAFVNCAARSIQWRWSWTAIVVFSLFLLLQLIGASFQAAFGFFPAAQTKEEDFEFFRIVDNLEYARSIVLRSADTWLSADVDQSVNHAIIAGNDEPVNAFIFFTMENATRENPLFDAYGALYRLMRFKSTDNFPASNEYNAVTDHGFATARDAHKISTPVEAFYADADCTDILDSLSPPTLTNTSIILELQPKCKSGNHTFIWQQTDDSNLGDTHACDNEDGPIVYLFQANLSKGTLTTAFECYISVSSAIVDVVVVPQNKSAYVDSDPLHRQRIPSSYPLGRCMGLQGLNSHGRWGWDALDAGLDKLSRRMAELLVETTAKITTAHQQLDLNFELANSSNRSMSPTSGQAQYDFVALAIHLSGRRLGWLAVPSLLLLLILALATYLLIFDVGDIDLTDPRNTALIGLSSPQNTAISAFAGKTEGSMRIRLGESTQTSNGGPSRLVFVAGDAEMGLVEVQEPERSKEYA